MGSKFAVCMWTFTKEALTTGQIKNPSSGGVPEEKNVVHYAMHKLGMCQHVEEVMGMELNYKIDSPCVVQWCMLWFSAPTRLDGIFENSDLKFHKYHEALNTAIADAENGD